MINFIKDLFSYFKFKISESNHKVGFFSENNYILKYLEPYILKKLKKEKVVIISFEKIINSHINDAIIFVFYTQFFRELVFLTLKLKYLYSSTPDLNQTIFKRSKLSKCKYIYLQHTPVSLTMIYNENAYDAFDAVQTINTFQFNEMKEIAAKRKISTKPFKSRYLFIEKEIEKNKIKKYEIDLIVAPSWNSSFYKLNCHLLLKNALSDSGISYKIRPHPMSIKKKEISLNELKKLNMPVDQDTSINFFKYNFLISDWSGIFIEFALIYKRSAFLLNTPKKMLNKNYLKYDNQPIEITLRGKLAKTYEIDTIKNIVSEIRNLKKQFAERGKFIDDEKIIQTLNKHFY